MRVRRPAELWRILLRPTRQNLKRKLVSGTLPAGLTLSAATGVISGTPTTVEISEAFTVQVSDSQSPSQSSSESLSLTINAAGATAVSVTTTSLPSGQVGSAYSATLAAAGGNQASVTPVLTPYNRHSPSFPKVSVGRATYLRGRSAAGNHC